jgi:hypothetical protein
LFASAQIGKHPSLMWTNMKGGKAREENVTLSWIR